MIRKLKMNEEEINRIMTIWKQATIKAHEFISEDYWLKSYDVVKEKYIPMAENYVYFDDEEIKGFISILNEEHIGALFVDVNCQGKGIGRKLIEYTRQIYDKLTLAVYKKNDQAVRFYKQVGFTITYEQLNEETNEPEYIMSS
ncbi:N-acetyltransferase [Brassicibacter mesophilus]|jgi:putative acetyltransferase|uniref:N-acetyltransferase n=1 Tax=Brassicibacter mesophilus TaxID=745119 RepID=UPI003D1E6183